MAVLGSESNVYDITRNTLPSAGTTEDLIKDVIDDEVPDMIEDAGPGVIGDNQDVIVEIVEEWENGYNFAYADMSDEDKESFILALGVRAEWGEDISSAVGIVMDATANDYYSKSEINSFSYSTYGEMSAYVDTSIGTYASSVESIAYNQSLLEVTYDNITTNITQGALVWAGDVSYQKVHKVNNTAALCTLAAGYPYPTDSSTKLEIGDIGEILDVAGSGSHGEPDVNKYYQFVGPGIVGSLGCGWIKNAAMANGDNYSEFGTAHSLYTDNKGNITGWQYVGGEGVTNEFIISASTFKLVDANNSGTPSTPVFDVDVTGKYIKFNGTVEIGQVDGATMFIPGDFPTSRPPKADGSSGGPVLEGDTCEVDGIIYGYADGSWGARGAVSTSHESGSSPYSSAVNAAFISNTGLKDYVSGDTLTWTKTGSYGGTTQWYRTGTGTSWNSYELKVNGNAIVKGSIWVEGNVESTNYDWNSGIPEGFKLSANGTGDANGHNIVGGSIYGGSIYGSTIQASFLDMSSGLSILTDYKISSSSYNSNPSLYSDAVYIQADNQWRLPAAVICRDIDYARTAVWGSPLPTNTTVGSTIDSYDRSNSGNTIKAKSAKPTIQVVANTKVIRANARGGGHCGSNSGRVTIRFYLGNTMLFSLSVWLITSCDAGQEQQVGSITNSYGSDVSLSYSHTSYFTSAGVSFIVTPLDPNSSYRDVTYEVAIVQGVYIPTVNVTGNTYLYRSMIYDQTYTTSNYNMVSLYTSKNISINNLE